MLRCTEKSPVNNADCAKADGSRDGSAAARMGGHPGPQKDRQPGQQSAEVIASGDEDGVGGVGEVVAAHAVLGLEMADARLDCETAA